MSVRIMHPPYRRVPWKNGLGTTLEIATDASEPGGPWTWRLSLADVPSRAPFSVFPGIDRHLAVLDGAGMTVRRSTRADDDATSAPTGIPREGVGFAFAGEDVFIGEPLGTGVRDANLMLDRRMWRGSLEIVRATEDRSIVVDADAALVFAAQGAIFLSFESRDESFTVPEGSTVLLHGRATLVARDLAASQRAIVIARMHALEGHP